MEYIIIGAELTIGIILGVIAIAAVGFFAAIIIGAIVSIIDNAKANKRMKNNLDQNKSHFSE